MSVSWISLYTHHWCVTSPLFGKQTKRVLYTFRRTFHSSPASVSLAVFLFICLSCRKSRSTGLRPQAARRKIQAVSSLLAEITCNLLPPAHSLLFHKSFRHGSTKIGAKFLQHAKKSADEVVSMCVRYTNEVSRSFAH